MLFRSVVALAVLFAAVALAAPQTMAGQGKEKKAEAKKLEQWGGLIVGMNKEKSTLSVSQMGFTKTVVYDSSTKWFKDNGKKPADPSEVREDIE